MRLYNVFSVAKLAESVPDVEESEGVDLLPKRIDSAVVSKKPGYFVRLGSLSTKLRHRAYQYAVTKLKMARDNIKEAFYWLHTTISVVRI